MEQAHAPYNFVPLSPRVVYPDWADVPAWDVPFEDGICGTIDLELEAHTPMFVRGTGGQQGGDRFFTLPSGEAAVPGSSVRGMIRSVVEIAGFGKLSRYNDHRYGVRDLNNRQLYTGHMAELMVPEGGHDKVPLPLVDAGWLVRRSGAGEDSGVVAEIIPCDYAKIHYRDLISIARSQRERAFDPGARQSAAAKYRAWGAPNGEEAQRTVSVDLRRRRPRGSRFLSEFHTARPGETRTGLLVFTGQPQQWRPDDPRNRAKQHDFVFLDATPGSSSILVDEQTFAGFEFVHSDRGQQGRMVDGRAAPNDEWGFWRPVFDRGGRVPVFFLLWPDSAEAKSGQLRAFGLAMMFRLAYDHSIGDAVRNAQPDADSDRPDLAELMFGSVPSRQKSGTAEEPSDEGRARRGRISVGLFRAVGKVAYANPVSLVLAAPKASYYPNYIEQGPGHGDLPARVGPTSWDYTTLMDEDVRVRGWKRYRPQEVVRSQPVPTRGDGRPLDTARVGTTFTPLEAGAALRGTVRVHNVRRVELGALLWAFEFGGEPECYHTLGMARSFGYGRVSLRIAGTSLASNNGTAVDLNACRDDFVHWMESQLRGNGGWQESVQIRDLLALARVVPRDVTVAQHMALRRVTAGQVINEFQEVKRLGLALPPVGREQGRAPNGTEPGTRAAPPRPSPVAPAPTRKWPGIAGGTRVKARLVEMTASGKWRVTLEGYDAKGVVGLGTPPPDVAPGDIVDVVVTGGGNPANLVIKWP